VVLYGLPISLVAPSFHESFAAELASPVSATLGVRTRLRNEARSNWGAACCSTRPILQMPRSGPERNRLVNFFQPAGERLRDFVTEILGCGRNLEGSFRSLVGPSRNRERRGPLRNRRKPLRERQETRNAGSSRSGRFALTSGSASFAAEQSAPRKEPSS